MAKIDKKKLSERDICTKYITPALTKAGWDVETDIREEVTFTDTRKSSRGRVKVKRADYILNHKNTALAIIEAKRNKFTVGHGMQQAIEYAEILELPFMFSSNGDSFVFRDGTAKTPPLEREITLGQFPAPELLLAMYQKHLGLSDKGLALITQDYHTEISGKEPRYYQVAAISRTMEAIANNQRRILLVMATGTGKTYTAFQIIWRLWKAKAKKRILFLADRNILVDQARNNDFAPFGGAMTKISKRMIDKSYEIYLSLYQAVTGSEEEDDIYKQFSRDFFDLIVIDECHRGSADEASRWRKILDYFSSATHIGLTATPKETTDVSNVSYFGEAVYTYSLKQGIEDGFLAPYKVVRIDIDTDQGWSPTQGQRDKHDHEIEDRVYNHTDMDQGLVLEPRTKLVARIISDYLRKTGRYDKTIVFCDNIDHAERMRQALVNENADIARDNPRYVMRITGDDTVGKAELDNFIDPESIYPVIATTSKLLSTGVDAQTCKLVVLDQTIRSMTDFKQIIGRGTRVFVDEGNPVCPEKLSFTIIDFKRATELFADPDFDGPALVVYEPKPGQSPVPPDDSEEDEGGKPQDQVGTDHLDDGADEDDAKPRRYIVADAEVSVVSERVQYYGPGGKLITESLRDYTATRVKGAYDSLDSFLRSWSQADNKTAVIRELQDAGVLFQPLAEEFGKDFSPFDLICHVVYGQPPLTRRERAAKARKRDAFAAYDKPARAVLDALLNKYADGGLDDIESMEVLKVQPLSAFGSVMEIVQIFGGKPAYERAIRELESALYSA